MDTGVMTMAGMPFRFGLNPMLGVLLGRIDAAAATLPGTRRIGALLPMVVLIWGLMFSWAAGAADEQAKLPAELPPAEASSAMERAEVRLDGVALFHVRGIMAFPAAKRAEDIAGRLRAIAKDASIPVESLRIEKAEDRTTILAGERLVMNVIDDDAKMEGVRRNILAELYLKRIATAIIAYRNDRSPDVLLSHSLYAAGATLVLVALIVAFRRAFAWLDGAATRRMATQIEELSRETLHIFDVHQLWRALRGVLKGLRRLITVVALYLYLNFVLELYPWTRPAARAMFDLIMDPLRAMGAALVKEIPSLITLAILFLVTRYVLRLTMLFFSGVERGSIKVAGMDSEVIWPTYRIVRLLIIVFALVVAYPYIPGSETDAFKGISLFMGLVFSLGSTTVIGNIIAGYTMIYRRAFRIGDRIKVGDVTGEVLERHLLVTRLRSYKNEEIVIPNTEILNSNIINYSTLAKSRGLILHTTVGIGYETPWRQVEAMLLMAAARTPGLQTTPEPFVLQKALGDFAVTYELNAYCDQPETMMQRYAALHQNILDLFNEYGVQIMTPAYEGDTEQPKVVPRERWFDAPAKPPSPT